MIISSGMLNCLTLSRIRFLNADFISSKSSGKCLTPFVPFLLENPMRFSSDNAQSFVISMGPPFSLRRVLCLYKITSLAPAITICELSTPPATRYFRTYAFTSSSYTPSFRGRPRGECGNLCSFDLVGLARKCFFILLTVLSFTFLPNVLLKWAAVFVGPFSIAYFATFVRVSGE